MSDRRFAQFVGLLLALIIALALTLGCSSTKMCTALFPKACDPVTKPCEPVFVETYSAPDKLPMPEEPEYEVDKVTEDATWRDWLKAIGVDWTRSQEYIAKLRHIIESFNTSVDAANDAEDSS